MSDVKSNNNVQGQSKVMPHIHLYTHTCPVRHNLYSSTSIMRMLKSRRMRCTIYEACKGEKTNTCGILLGKRQLKWGVKDWIDLADSRCRWQSLVNTVNLCVPQKVGQFLRDCTTGGFSRRTQLQRVS
jgi:hypothetical protein